MPTLPCQVKYQGLVHSVQWSNSLWGQTACRLEFAYAPDTPFSNRTVMEKTMEVTTCLKCATCPL